jgi:ubiquinone/menaquinone biosynthesis C-methylase UbiE
LDYAGSEHIDPAFVAGYDHKQGSPDLTSDVDVFAAHGLGSTSIVVDLGAGTGAFAVAAARRFRHVIAVDVSPVMLNVGRGRAQEAGLVNIDFVPAGFLGYRHSGPLADGVYTRNALHHLPDFWKVLALDRIAGIMRTGGVLRLHDLIYDFRPGDANRVFDQWFKGAANDSVRGYTRQDFERHIRTEHSTFRWLLEPMLAKTGFEILTAEFAGSVYGAYTCIKR